MVWELARTAGSQALSCFTAPRLTHHSAAFTLVSRGASIGHCSVSLAVKHLSSEHQPCVRTGACRNVQESTYHYMQPTAGRTVQFLAMLTCIKTHQQWFFFHEIPLSFSRALQDTACLVFSVSCILSSEFSQCSRVSQGRVCAKWDPQSSVLDLTSGASIYMCKGLHRGSAVSRQLLSLHPLLSPSPLKHQIWIVCLLFEPKKLALAYILPTVPAVLLILTEFQITIVVLSSVLCLMSGEKWLTYNILLLTTLLFCNSLLKILSFALTFSKHKKLMKFFICQD